jgi:hypothetical protein
VVVLDPVDEKNNLYYNFLRLQFTKEHWKAGDGFLMDWNVSKKSLLLSHRYFPCSFVAELGLAFE